LQEEERKLRDKFARVRFQTDEFLLKNELLEAQNKLLAREKQPLGRFSCRWFL